MKIRIIQKQHYSIFFSRFLPVRHEQIMVRKGTVSTTEQTALVSQGFNSTHGFLHLLSKQARPGNNNLEGIDNFC